MFRKLLTIAAVAIGVTAVAVAPASASWPLSPPGVGNLSGATYSFVAQPNQWQSTILVSSGVSYVMDLRVRCTVDGGTNSYWTEPTSPQTIPAGTPVYVTSPWCLLGYHVSGEGVRELYPFGRDCWDSEGPFNWAWNRNGLCVNP